MRGSYLDSLSDHIRSALTCIGEKLRWRRTMEDSITEDEEPQLPAEPTDDEVIDPVDGRKSLPRRLRNQSMNVSFYLIDQFGRARAHQIIYDGLENLICQMMNKKYGIPLYTVTRKSESLLSVFTGIDLISWIMKNMKIKEDDAIYLGNLLSSFGFLYPIDDHTLTVKNDDEYYRFQSPYYWKSGIADGNDYDYAAYLTRRSIYNSYNMYDPLSKHELINLSKFQLSLNAHWKRIQGEAVQDINFTEQYSKEEKQLIFSQQRAFWDLHRPLPGVQRKPDFDYQKLLMLRPYFEMKKLSFPLRFPEKHFSEVTLKLVKRSKVDY